MRAIIKTKPLDRRLFLQSSVGALLTSQFCLSGCDEISEVADMAYAFRHIDVYNNGRLGLSVYSKERSFDFLLKDNNFESGQEKTLNERFALCSTFKLPLAAMVLRAIDLGDIRADTRIPISDSDILGHAPVTKKNLQRGSMSIIKLAEAAQKTSDNTAANLLLPLIGGPAGFTEEIRKLGDDQTRLDRMEPEMNLVGDDEIRDTTTPYAMARTLSAIFETNYLSDQSRAMLKKWMIATTTGARRVRAGLPNDWTSGDKTGTGIAPQMANIYGDIGVIWRQIQSPIYFAAYYQADQYYDSIRPEDEAMLANAGKMIAEIYKKS